MAEFFGMVLVAARMMLFTGWFAELFPKDWN